MSDLRLCPGDMMAHLTTDGSDTFSGYRPCADEGGAA
jgi:hypothetical protein